MPHISVPAAELNARLDRLRRAMTEKDPSWSMLLLDNKIDMYYFTGTMQEGALVVTPDQATLFVRRSFDVAKDESAFADIRPMGSFRGIKEVYADIPETGAGAGLSTSAGFVYTGERFEKHFHDFAEKYHFSDMYSGGFYPRSLSS